MKVKSLLLFLSALLIWHLISITGILPEYSFPGPLLVISSFKPQMALGISATLARTVSSFLTGVLGAYGAIYLAHITQKMPQADAQFAAARAVPMLAAMPLLIMWFGLGELIKLIVISLSVIAFVAGPLAESARTLPREWTLLRQQLDKSLSWEYWHIIMPGTFGSMIGALRVAMAVAITIAIATDFMGSTVGIGRSLDSARVTFNTPAIFLLLITTAAVGVALDSFLSSILRHIGHWVGSTSKA